MIKKSELYKELIGRIIWADGTHYQSDWIADRIAKHLNSDGIDRDEVNAILDIAGAYKDSILITVAAVLTDILGEIIPMDDDINLFRIDGDIAKIAEEAEQNYIHPSTIKGSDSDNKRSAIVEALNEYIKSQK